jgi:hypothetical protein
MCSDEHDAVTLGGQGPGGKLGLTVRKAEKAEMSAFDPRAAIQHPLELARDGFDRGRKCFGFILLAEVQNLCRILL